MRLLLILGLLLLIAGASFYGWVMTGPRTITWLNDYVENKLDKALPGYHVHITDNTLSWDETQHTLDLRITDITVQDAENNNVASFPEIKINLTLAYLFIGQLKLTDLVIISPSFNFAIGSDEASTESGELFQKIADKLLVFRKLQPEQAALQNIQIQDANFTLTTPNREININIQNTDTAFKKENGIVHINNRIHAAINSHLVFFETNMSFPDDDTVQLDAAVSKFPTDLLREFMPNNEIVKNLDLVIDAAASVKLPHKGLPVIERISIANASGTLSHPVYFTNPVTITSFELEASVEADFTKIMIDKMEAVFADNATLQASGSVEQKDMALKAITLDANATNVPIDNIRYYWPSGIIGAPVRDWVVERISSGNVPKASIALRVTEEDFNNHYLARESLDAIVEFNDSSVNYFDAYPPAANANGTAHFTGTDMDIAITSGTILNSTVEKASVVIPDFRQHPATITITGNATGSPADLTAYFDHKAVGTILKTDFTKLGGKATSTVKLDIPLQAPVTLQDMTIDISSVLEDATLPNLLGRYNISQANLTLQFTGKALTIAGDALANNAPLKFRSNTAIPTEKNQNIDGTYEIRSILNKASARSLLLMDLANFSGSAPFTLTINHAGGVQEYQLNGNFDNAGFVIEKLGWQKPVGMVMPLALVAKTLPNNQLQVTAKIVAPAIQIAGTGYVASDFSDIYAMDISTLRLGKNDFSVGYSQDATRRLWNIKGRSVDLSTADFGKLFTSSGSGEKKSLQAYIQLGNVVMKNDEIIQNVAGQLQCHQSLCHTGKFSAIVGQDGKLTLTLKPGENNTSQLSMESDNANNIARALNIYDDMQEGYLYLNAKFLPVAATNEQQAHSAIEGELRIDNFTATKAPILAKIATLASFEGLTGILENKGIRFKRLFAPFRFENDTIFLNNAKAHGDSLGITAKGKIYTDKRVLDIGGTFVPSYAVNNILGKIPLVGRIGEVLMGGKGEGILAVRYTVKGAYNNAEVSVNPLSILTPGFLRNLFDIVDYIVPETNSDLAKISPAAGGDKENNMIGPKMFVGPRQEE